MRAILTYHSIDDSGSVISVSPERFAHHVAWLASGVVRVTTLEELMSLRADADAVALTFDDGFDNFASQAWPRLREHDLPATVFVVTEHAGADNRWGSAGAGGIPAYPLMGWDTLARLREEGVALGSHTRTHASLTQVALARLTDELAGSQETIRVRTGAVATALAYPFGDVDSRVTDAAAAFYRCGVTTELRTLASADSHMLLPRLDMFYFRDPGQIEAWGTSAFRLRLALRAAARRARRGVARG
jgi:peptidoglycan/xylan/chitin deacetylase (PgdA/CDA1 family)